MIEIYLFLTNPKDKISMGNVEKYQEELCLLNYGKVVNTVTVGHNPHFELSSMNDWQYYDNIQILVFKNSQQIIYFAEHKYDVETKFVQIHFNVSWWFSWQKLRE